MGATNILLERRRAPTRRATMLRMAQIYAERFADPTAYPRDFRCDLALGCAA